MSLMENEKNCEKINNILSYNDFKEFVSHYYDDHGGIQNIHEKQVLPYCLRLMYIMNNYIRKPWLSNKLFKKLPFCRILVKKESDKERRLKWFLYNPYIKINEDDLRRKVYHISYFLGNAFKTKFNSRHKKNSSRCPKGGHCDMRCDYEYDKCKVEPPDAFLRQTKKQIDSIIKRECRKNKINLVEYLCKGVVEKILKDLKIEEQYIHDYVQSRFMEIINGINYTVRINYYGEADPWIMVLQEILLAVPEGYITSEVALAERYNPDEMPENKKNYIKNELLCLKFQFDMGHFLELESLLINSKYPEAKSMVFELINSIALRDGSKLVDKIRRFDEYSLPERFYCGDLTFLLEVHVPFVRGFFDFHTVRAIKYINERLRPKETKFRSTVDKYFLEAIVRKYSLQFLG